MKIYPAPDRLVLEHIEQKQESVHGIVMSNRMSGESAKGRLMELGFEALSRFEGIKKGDVVFIAAGCGEMVVVDGERRLLVHHNDVLAWTSGQ